MSIGGDFEPLYRRRGNYKEVAAMQVWKNRREEQKKAFAETVRRIKKNSLDDPDPAGVRI